jgi:hypothetical protein
LPIAFLLGIALLLSGNGSTIALGESLDWTFLGIVRNDGLLVPIAIYDGKTWWNPTAKE